MSAPSGSARTKRLRRRRWRAPSPRAASTLRDSPTSPRICTAAASANGCSPPPAPPTGRSARTAGSAPERRRPQAPPEPPRSAAPRRRTPPRPATPPLQSRAEATTAPPPATERQGRTPRSLRQALALMLALLRVEAGRHVILVMLGEDLARGEQPIRPERPFRDHAAPFLEQVGDDALVAHPDPVRALVADGEGDRHPVRRPLQRALLDHPADPNRPLRHLPRLQVA